MHRALASLRGRVPSWDSISQDPARLRRVINLWPPHAAAGIRVTMIAADWSRVESELRLRPWTANYVGTQFGGSLFSMTDPWWMIMLLNRLGKGYIVWDKAAEIDFVAPGRGTVRAVFSLPDSVVEEVREQASDGKPVLRWFEVSVLDADGTLVSRVRKQVYIRRKP